NRSIHQDTRKTSKGLKPYSCLWKLRAFFSAPIVKFYYNVVSYVGFLWLFAYVLTTDFQTYPSWREYLLYIWVFTIFTEELRQLSLSAVVSVCCNIRCFMTRSIVAL
ncbi:unnamed protein product, partial [Staurois parvus]